MPSPTSPPPGFYPAPHAGNQVRYWDGQRWHEQGPPPPAGMPQPGQHPARPRLAIAALSLGILALVVSRVPLLGSVVALAAVGAGVAALVKRQKKGFAIAGLVLGVVALMSGFAATPSAEPKKNSPPVSSQTSEVTPASVATPTPEAPIDTPPEATAPEPAPLAERPASGSVDDPLPQPYIARGVFGGEKYSLTSKIVDTNAGNLIQKWNRFNDKAPQGFKYVVIEITITGIDPDGVEPSLATFDLRLATGEGNKYSDEFVVFGDKFPRIDSGPTLYPGSTFTGYAAYIVPEASDRFLLHDNGKYIAL